MNLKNIIFFFIFTITNILSAADGQNSDLKIRILINKTPNKITLSTHGKIYIQEINTSNKFLLVSDANYHVSIVESKNILIAKQKLTSPVKIIIPDGPNYVKIKDKKYKGEIKVVANQELYIIEEIPLERYLYGVLAPEMGPDWPIEALKAQAVASRTYAAKQINPSKDYDISDNVYHQVYTGFERVNSAIIEAVNSTRGEILTYNKKIITAFFHACCGGHTTTPSSVWDEDLIRPLKGVSDPYCKLSNHYNWDIFISDKDLLSFIQKLGSTALKINNIRTYSKDKSGRAVRLLFSTDKGNFRAEVKEMRKFFGTYEFKSTFITRIEKKENGYKFYGKGWGHGVGMCQEGAKQMAYKGKKYDQILKFYYPGTKIMDIEDFFK